MCGAAVHFPSPRTPPAAAAAPGPSQCPSPSPAAAASLAWMRGEGSPSLLHPTSPLRLQPCAAATASDTAAAAPGDCVLQSAGRLPSGSTPSSAQSAMWSHSRVKLQGGGGWGERNGRGVGASHPCHAPAGDAARWATTLPERSSFLLQLPTTSCVMTPPVHACCLPTCCRPPAPPSPPAAPRGHAAAPASCSAPVPTGLGGAGRLLGQRLAVPPSGRQCAWLGAGRQLLDLYAC